MPAIKGKDNSQQKSSPTKENDTGCKKRRTPQGPRGQSQSCHQCRQSIYSSKGASELKLGQQRVKCSQCTRYWCEKCLNNRYGLERNEINLSLWVCPVCANNCNCSLCRKKSGKLATGILTPLAKNAGFSSVSEFLQKGTDDIAKCLQWQQSPSQPIKRTLSSTDDISTSKRRKLCHSQYNITMNDDDNEWVEESNNFVTKDDHTHSIIKDKIPTSSSTRQLRSRTIHPVVTSRKTRSCKAVTKQLKCELEPLQDQDEVGVETNKCLPNMVDEKQEELIKLKMSVICKIKEDKIQQKLQDKIERQRHRLEKRQKLLKEKEMKRLTNMRLHKAKLLLKEARHHDKQRHKQMSELKKLMIKKQQERHLKTKLMRQPLSILPDSSSSLLPFTPLSPLPNYPLLEVGVAQTFIPALLFVCEYLYAFTDIQINAASLVVALEKSPGHVFKSLLNLLLQCSNNKVPDVNDCNAEKISNQILLQIGYNEDTENTTTVEARIQHLTSLCYATLETASIGDIIKESIATSVQEKKKLIAKRQDLTKQITDELKKLCDEGASIEELTAKRNEFSEQIQDIHQATPSYNKIRRLPLGQDRNNRLYWQLVSVPGIVVEDGTIWSIINNSDLLDQVLMSLQVSDVEEKKLYNNLKALTKIISF